MPQRIFPQVSWASGWDFRRVYLLVSAAWALTLLVFWWQSVLVGSPTPTTLLLTAEGMLLSAAVVWAVWRRWPLAQLNLLLLLGLTFWVMTRLLLRVLLDGGVQGISFVMFTGLSALAFTVLLPSQAVLYSLGAWGLLGLASLFSQPNVWDLWAAAGFAMLMVGYASLAGRQVMVEREGRQEAEYLASTDRLTGLNNRASGEHELVAALHDWQVLRQNSVLMLLDVDHFKAVNDTHGHATGDEVLRVVAAALAKAVHGRDMVCRWGGEEFVVLFRQTGPERAQLLAERLMTSIRSQDIAPVGRVTVSIGVVSLNEHAQLSNLLALADKRLYVAKAAGRNQAAFA